MDKNTEKKFNLISTIIDLTLLVFTMTIFIVSTGVNNSVLTKVANIAVMIILGLTLGSTVADLINLLREKE